MLVNQAKSNNDKSFYIIMYLIFCVACNKKALNRKWKLKKREINMKIEPASFEITFAKSKFERPSKFKIAQNKWEEHFAEQQQKDEQQMMSEIPTYKYNFRMLSSH